MEAAMVEGQHYALGPRIPVLVNVDTMEVPTATSGTRGPSRIWNRAPEATTSVDCKKNPNLCQKTGEATDFTIPIACGVAIPLVAIILTLLYLHRRHNKRLKREDETDPHKNLDFGLEEAPAGGRNKRKSMLGALGGNGKEKDHNRFKQMSMDMNLSSPYLLPPGLHGSRESIQTLTKGIDPSHDPYRPVAQLVADAARSPSRGPSRGPRESQYSTASNETRNGGRSPFNAPGPRQNSFPRQPAPPAAQMKPQPTAPQLSIPSSSPLAKDPFSSPSEISRPSMESAQFPDEKDFVVTPIVQEPAATAAYQNAPGPIPEQQPGRSDSESSNGVMRHDQNGDRHRSQQGAILERGSSMANNSQQRPSMGEPHTAGPILEEPQQYHEYNDYSDYANMPEGDYEQQQQQGHYDDHDDGGRGRTQYRESATSNYGQEPQPGQSGGLGVPAQDARRLSVGVRPLPPDKLMDTEDPETRANRIRSFYKEYFDDSGPKPDVPQIPQHAFATQQRYHQQQGHQQGAGSVQYYEDYDQGYGGHGAEEPYYDPSANAFVMPYAQPVARRAMTPPPSGSRFQGGGPRGPPGPRGMQGMGPPGPRFQGSRSGSPASSRYGPPRPGSAMSQGNWGNRPRAGSSHSGVGGRGTPKKALPPPSALTTLPTPSKLKDDSFALFNALDFAPPELMKDRAAGRSQSPLGERRPYQVTVPAHSPLVNAFEEMPSLPSPHLLRKSATFTALDFAPPRKFAGSDAGSDAGSIRSNRSGISAAQQQALRSGAGRVSRLPGDTIFTQVEQAQKLKPEWTMRP